MDSAPFSNLGEAIRDGIVFFQLPLTNPKRETYKRFHHNPVG
jgi:hypothetical protein